MDDGGDVSEHIREFLEAVYKLQEMEVDINEDLLTMMLLYDFPPRFYNFRCVIESRDDLSTLEAL